MSQPPYQPYGASPDPGQPGYPPPPAYPPAPQPGYPAAAPAAPGYPPVPPQPAYQPGYPPAPPAPPAPPSYPVGVPETPPTPAKGKAVGKIIGVIAVVLIVGIAAVLYFALKGSSIRVQTPTTLLGLSQTTNPEIASSMNDAKSQIDGSVDNATSTVAAAYGEIDSQNLIMVIAASGRVGDQSKELNDAMTGFGSAFGGGTAQTVDAGPLGGVARCMDVSTSGVAIAVCGWADDGSLGLVLFYFKKTADVKADFITARSAVEVS